MILPTKNKLPAMACLSAMQKCIRCGLELDAMRFAVELHQTSTPFATMVTNRLEIISHEDIDTMTAPWIAPYVRAACEQARAWYDPKKLGKSRMATGNCVRMMACAPFPDHVIPGAMSAFLELDSASLHSVEVKSQRGLRSLMPLLI